MAGIVDAETGKVRLTMGNLLGGQTYISRAIYAPDFTSNLDYNMSSKLP